jgi:hypothetical protein
VSVQDRCMACIKRTIGLEIVLDKVDGTPGEWHIGISFLSVHDVLVSKQDRCMVYAKCTIRLEIVLDAPDGPPSSRGSSGSSFRTIWR